MRSFETNKTIIVLLYFAHWWIMWMTYTSFLTSLIWVCNIVNSLFMLLANSKPYESNFVVNIFYEVDFSCLKSFRIVNSDIKVLVMSPLKATSTTIFNHLNEWRSSYNALTRRNLSLYMVEVVVKPNCAHSLESQFITIPLCIGVFCNHLIDKFISDAILCKQISILLWKSYMEQHDML